MWQASRETDPSTRCEYLGNLLVVGLPLLRARGPFIVSVSLQKRAVAQGSPSGSQDGGWDDL